MAAFLFGQSANDPLVFSIVPCIMVLIILLACWPPARRAAGSIQLSLYATTSGWYSGIPLAGYIPSKRKLQVRSTISIARSNPVPAGGVY